MPPDPDETLPALPAPVPPLHAEPVVAYPEDRMDVRAGVFVRLRINTRERVAFPKVTHVTWISGINTITLWEGDLLVARYVAQEWFSWGLL